MDKSGFVWVGDRAALASKTSIVSLVLHSVSAVTPLFRIEGYTVVDAQGPGAFFMPAAKHSLSNNVDLTAGGQLFATALSGEFQRVPNLFYLQFTVHY